MTADSECLFCKIVAGEVPAEIVASDEHTVAFRDISPQAPTHVLVIPREHHADAAALAATSAKVAPNACREYFEAPFGGLDDEVRCVKSVNAKPSDVVHVLYDRVRDAIETDDRRPAQNLQRSDELIGVAGGSEGEVSLPAQNIDAARDIWEGKVAGAGVKETCSNHRVLWISAHLDVNVLEALETRSGGRVSLIVCVQGLREYTD